jgi:hypothetical protein
MEEAVGYVSLEIALAAALQKALSQPQLTDDEKAIKCRDAILQTLKKNAEDGKGQLFFDPKYSEAQLKDLCHSVAVEELHDCYFERCNLQAKLGVGDKGVIFAVYGDRGTGKSYGLRSLIGMRHGRAPRQGYYFAGTSIYKTGDEYYKSLLDTCLGRGLLKAPLSRVDDIFDPESVALWIVSSLPEWNPKAKGPMQRRGLLAIPGVSHYVDSQARLPGGAPVVVFDDVNIHLDLENLGSNQAVLMEQLGKAGTFFAMIMTAAYQRGVIVFVATSNLLVAKFLHGLNSGKARAVKPVTDADSKTSRIPKTQSRAKGVYCERRHPSGSGQRCCEARRKHTGNGSRTGQHNPNHCTRSLRGIQRQWTLVRVYSGIVYGRRGYDLKRARRRDRGIQV